MQAAKPAHLPGLDLVRGIAILMVLLDHGLASDPSLYNSSNAMRALGHALRLGHFGVHLFFILSGLLITGILLDTRTDPDYFRNFYIRRVLRILPAYLLLLVFLFATHTVTARYLGLCLLFLANVPSLFHAGNQYSALWSLSVEEQFYLVWPITVRKLSLRALTILCITIVALTPALRFALLHAPPILHDIRFKPWAVGDFFAAGALIAIATSTPNLRPILRNATLLLAALATTLVILLHFLRPIHLRSALYLEPPLLFLTAVTLFFLLHPNIPARPLIFLAKISYGLYLIHPFIFDRINQRWPLPASTPFPQLLLRFLLESSAAIAIATLSRFTVEQFFLRLKPKHTSSRLHSQT